MKKRDFPHTGLLFDNESLCDLCRGFLAAKGIATNKFYRIGKHAKQDAWRLEIL